jgi:DNA mismatch repair protein MutS
VAERGRWTRPALDEGDTIEIRGGRHPVLEHTGATVIANDCRLANGGPQLALLTGPNMAGKSTYLRQVAVIVLLAQIGSFVPADFARIGLVDRIFTRVGAQDDISAGQSTFMVEMAETANILRHATPRSLLVFDEIGRGTSTYDGLAIARSVIEYIHNHPELGCKTLFATHYHELTELEGVLPRVRNYRIDVLDEGEEIVFLHKVVPGAADRSYGIHVARLAGVPRAVTRRAEEILRDLEHGGHAPAPSANGQTRPGKRRLRARQELVGEPGGLPLQLTLFGEPDPVVEAVKALDLHSLTPLEALAKLYELQAEAKREA